MSTAATPQQDATTGSGIAFVSPQAEAAYAQRMKRVLDCVALRTPDRMPTSLISGFWYARYAGVTCRELMYNYERSNEISEQVILEFEPDIAVAAARIASWGPLLDALDFRQLEWAGHGVGEDTPYQYLDREYMRADEYDDFLLDPTAFFFERYLPRVAGAFDGLQPLAALSGLSYMGIAAGSFMFNLPTVTGALERLRKAGEESMRSLMSIDAITQRLATLGFPPAIEGAAQAPYDVLADYMRGAKNMMMDVYRRPEQVLAALDKLGALILKRTLAMRRPGQSPIVTIPIHWAPDNFMSPKQFEKFYWPSFRKLMMGLIDEGMIPMPLWESTCTKRLETIADMPPGKCIYWFESTDMVKAFEVLGDTVALHGNLGASLMSTGSPDNVDAAVRHLAENVFHKGGKLILSTATPMPEETPIANVRAMFDAARKYGS